MIRNIFIVDGASGTGKYDLVRYVQQSRDCAVVRKYTTRDRIVEDANSSKYSDLNFVSIKEFKKYEASIEGFYTYSYGTNYNYGFKKKDIEELLKTEQNIFMIIRSIKQNLFDKLEADFPEVRIVKVYIYTDMQKFTVRPKTANSTRINAIAYAWADYLKYPQHFDEIIINDSQKENYERQIEQLILKYKNEPNDILVINNEKFVLPRSIVGYKDLMYRVLLKKPFHKNIFLMMKFRENNSTLFGLISRKLSSFGFNCVRADKPEWNITQDIYNPIATLFCCKYGEAI